MKKLLLIPIVGLQMLHAGTIQNLTVDQTITDSVKQKEKRYYKISVPKGKYLKVNLTELEADVDLYVKSGSKPTLRNNNCYSANSKNKAESCSYEITSDQDVYILVNGFRSSSFNLKASILDSSSITTLKIEDKATKNIKKGESHKYKIVAKKGDRLKFILSNKGDADLRVKIGREANFHVFDCKSTKGKDKSDECTVTLTNDATVYAYINGYRSSTLYTLYVEGEKFPENRFYLIRDGIKYFLAYESVEENGQRSTKVYVVNDETKEVTYFKRFHKMGGVNLKRIKGTDLFNFDGFHTINGSTIYTIDSDGKLIDINKKFRANSGDIHFNNYGHNNILKVYFVDSSKIKEVAFDVSNSLNPTIDSIQTYEEKELLNFIARYNCNKLHTNNKIGGTMNYYTFSSKVLCSEEENRAYILYNKKLTIINIHQPNGHPLATLENHHFLGGNKDSLHKINQNSIYTISSERIDMRHYEDIYSIYIEDKLSLMLQHTNAIFSIAEIKNIEYNNSKLTLHLERGGYYYNNPSIAKKGVKIYDISDIDNPKLIKDDYPNDKITILKK